MSYASVDRNIEDWASSNSFRLFREWDGQENRFTHLTNDYQQTMQIVVNKPVDGKITVHVRIIEGSDDLEFEASFTTYVEHIENALVAATALARQGILN